MTCSAITYGCIERAIGHQVLATAGFAAFLVGFVEFQESDKRS
jgi:hypothetical protein